MYSKRMVSGNWGVYSDENMMGCLAIMPTPGSAHQVVETWEADQATAERRWAETLKGIGSPAYGLGTESAINRGLVLHLGGYLTPT